MDSIVAPWGSGVEERPRVLSREEREERYWGKRRAKEGRREGGKVVGEAEGLGEGGMRVVEKRMEEVVERAVGEGGR